MLDIEQIESAILQLPPAEFQVLQEWVLDLDNRRWDEQLERDVADGKLEALTQEAAADFEAGHCREI
ncbi:MAG: hypothetical protein AAFY11_15810 [Cyanobacteria bacterium J06641_5]